MSGSWWRWDLHWAWYWARRWARRWAGVQIAVEFVDDVPVPCGRGVLHVTGDPAEPYQGVMSCPCGCGEAIWLDLTDHGGPSWRLHVGRLGRADLTPSVWRTEGCGSHFWVRGGRIDWSGARSGGDRKRRNRPLWDWLARQV